MIEDVKDPNSQALLTDLYQLTMAYAYWKNREAERESAFTLFFREAPFGGGFTIAAGLESVVRFLSAFRFSSSDLAYLADLHGADDKGLFDPDFLDYLSTVSFRGSLDAVEEGTVIFPQEPLLHVRGGLLECQLVETALLNLVNFPTLIATKAARVCLAAGDDPVLEFGLRRAQGVDGGLTASRASYLGGCSGTSNVLAGKLLGIPVRGTHAHSWVMTHETELQAFQAYAVALPNNCIFLVDTYNTLEGVRNAVEVARQLRRDGYQMIGIRLDSGDLMELSQRARQILDENDFKEAQIVASGDLDERKISELKSAGAKIDVWGVGTRLVTAFDDPALSGVYKLSALKSSNGQWEYTVKLSEGLHKMNLPGVVQIRRLRRDGKSIVDVLCDTTRLPVGELRLAGPKCSLQDDISLSGIETVDLLQPVMREGEAVCRPSSLEQARERCQRQLLSLPEEVRNLENPKVYPVCFEKSYWDRRKKALRKTMESAGRMSSSTENLL